MKKLSKKLKNYYLSIAIKVKRKQLHTANRRKHYKFLLKLEKVKNRDYYTTCALRDRVIRNLYKNRKYTDPPLTIDIKGEFGIEEQKGISNFLSIAESIIDFRSSKLTLQLADCTRVWPSAITLLCSLKQWVELTTLRGRKPEIRSTSSNIKNVNSYLAHCGFYDYVGRYKDTVDDSHSDVGTVKIERETMRSNSENRASQIMTLIKEHSTFSNDELESFNDCIVSEIISNITEHGISHFDRGWWLLAQHHPEHKIISLCVADNGIGIRNSLMTGPQRDSIRLDNEPISDGKFIKLALEENISGSINASVKSGKFIKKYEAGSRRGNGLKRIKDKCKELKIPLSILSNHGYCFLDNTGQFIDYGAKKNRIFAGTMCHMVIKSK